MNEAAPACASESVDPEWFYSVDSFDEPDLSAAARDVLSATRYRKARKVCAGCPIQEACLEENLRDPFGLYGGLAPPQRRAILADRGESFDELPSMDEPAIMRAMEGDLTVSLSPKERHEAIRRLLARQWSLTEVAEGLGISVKSVERVRGEERMVA